MEYYIRCKIRLASLFVQNICRQNRKIALLNETVVNLVPRLNVVVSDGAGIEFHVVHHLRR